MPPTYKKGQGRPKKLRRREPDEDPNPTKLKRSHTKYYCGDCHQQGHNTRKCPNRPVQEEPVQTTNEVAATEVRNYEGEQIPPQQDISGVPPVTSTHTQQVTKPSKGKGKASAPTAHKGAGRKQKNSTKPSTSKTKKPPVAAPNATPPMTTNPADAPPETVSAAATTLPNNVPAHAPSAITTVAPNVPLPNSVSHDSILNMSFRKQESC
ncbi:Zinc finger, CCHC-type superfamily [Sesbania bispinosa]|nr:Zinc finger, CCHC-type superfamily [Sesbania bispinosa]